MPINPLKKVLITGAASGLGRLAATQYAAKKIEVAALDIDNDGLTSLSKAFPEIHTYHVDITDSQAVTETIHNIYATFEKIDRVIHAAAIMPCGSIMEHPTANIHQVMHINYGGLVNLTKAILPMMLKQDYGQFVVFSSMLGIMPTLKTAAYSASKFATSVFTEILAQEHIDSNIQFACICPPAVKTPLLDQVKATAWPKILDETAPLSPQTVLNAMEKGLQKKHFWIYPDTRSSIGAKMRRLFPAQVWKHIHGVEKA